MRFGYGRTTYWSNEARNAKGERVRKVYDASMVAHIWANQSQDFARTSNGNFAFQGDSLFSYGNGWRVAKLWQGFALINGDKVSVTTSGHTNDARGACRHMPRIELPSFPDSLNRTLDHISALSRDIAALPKASETRREVTSQLREVGKRALANAELADCWRAGIFAAGEYYWSDAARADSRQLGDIIASVAGLGAKAWPVADAKHKREAERKAKAKAEAERKAFLAEARQAVTMTDKAFADSISVESLGYGGTRQLLQLAKRLRAYRTKGELSKPQKRILWLRECAARDKADNFEALKRIHDKRRDFPALARYVRQIPAMFSGAIERGESLSSHTVRTVGDNLKRLATYALLPSATRERLASYGDAMREVVNVIQAAEYEAAEKLRRENAAKREAERIEAEKRQAELRAAWLAGDTSARPSHFSRDDGTPYLRVASGELQTSWGASVPLDHAVKVFRFVKLCRERGQGWQRNGKTIRVGHFQVDSIKPSGDFIAGCHNFAWVEVERVARAAGVFESEADDSAVEPSGLAA